MKHIPALMVVLCATSLLTPICRSQDLIVGSSSSAETTNITSGTNNFNNTYVGYSADASNNTLNIVNAGTLLSNTEAIYLGYEGSENHLVISNGGTVANTSSYVGFFGTSSNNSALVTGVGSFWTSSDSLRFGYQGGGNTLVVSNGGVVANSEGFIGATSLSANNEALVTGAGSLWTNTYGFYVGNGGSSGNRLVISNGGAVSGLEGFIGVGSSQNSVLVTGAGSLWANTFGLYVGDGNNLTVADGGIAAAGSIGIGSSGTLDIGRYGTNDTAGTINAPTIAFDAGTGTINFNQRDATTISAAISGNGTLNQLGSGTTTLSGNNSYTGGTVIAGGRLATASASALGNGSVTVADGGTLAPGVGDALVIVGDVTFATGSAFVWQLLGNTTGGAGNFTPAANLSTNLDVAAGSAFELFFGASVNATNAFWGLGTSNSWTIFTGASPNLGAGTNFSLAWAAGSVTNGFDLAHFSLGTNATGLVLNYVADPLIRYLWNSDNGNWTNAASWIDSTVPGATNDAYIDNGGRALVIGSAAAARDLYVGSANSSNSLVISNAGTVASVSGVIGSAQTSLNNSVLVTGEGSTWTSSSGLIVGSFGSGNSLVISNGGTVTSVGGAFIGASGSSWDNSVLVTGANSLWSNSSGAVYVGAAGYGNSLTVADGGMVVAGSIIIGLSPGYSGTLNIGRYGTNDTAGTINAPTIDFGAGTGTINFNQRDATTISAAISGNGTVNQLGAGTTTLTGSNSYTGETTITAGALSIGNSAGLGSTSAGTTVAGGAALELQGGITIGAETLNLSGAGISAGGALRNISGNNTYQGTITNTAASRINSDAGTLTLSGAINAADQALTFGGAGNIMVNGTITNSIQGLTKDGSGTVTLGAANTYTGLTTVSGGTLSFGIANASGSGDVTVDGAAAVLDLGGFSGTVGAVSLIDGSITGTTGVLTGSSYAFQNGSVSAILAGNATMTKTAAGTVTLSGPTPTMAQPRSTAVSWWSRVPSATVVTCSLATLAAKAAWSFPTAARSLMPRASSAIRMRPRTTARWSLARDRLGLTAAISMSATKAAETASSSPMAARWRMPRASSAIRLCPRTTARWSAARDRSGPTTEISLLATPQAATA